MYKRVTNVVILRYYATKSLETCKFHYVCYSKDIRLLEMTGQVA
jgi:hypothetical protein